MVIPDKMDTIEIGLVVIDLESLEILDEFQRFVRPQINPTLTDFCTKLTSIQPADVDGARTHQKVGEELRTSAASYPNAAWASWGDFERDAGVAECPSLLEGLPHFNARKWHAGLYDYRPKSLTRTVESLGLIWLGTYHRGIDGTRNVASIVKEMLS